jgi:Protein of unknown function (DUF3135)
VSLFQLTENAEYRNNAKRSQRKNLQELNCNMELPDFDRLVEMAKNRPDELEALRDALIAEAIASARSGNRRRLRGLQFQIDMARKKAKTPMAACIRISALMHESLAELRAHLNDPVRVIGPIQRPNMAAKVLSMSEFRTRASNVGMA